MVTMKSTVNTLPYETENLQKQLLDSRSTIVQLQEKIRWRPLTHRIKAA
jgi:hypothetical protein